MHIIDYYERKKIAFAKALQSFYRRIKLLNITCFFVKISAQKETTKFNTVHTPSLPVSFPLRPPKNYCVCGYM